MTLDEYLGCLSDDADRIAEVGDAAIDGQVPSCPGWVVADVVVHVGWLQQLLTELARVPDGGHGNWAEPGPLSDLIKNIRAGQRPDGELLPWFRSNSTDLLRELKQADATKTIQTYLGSHQPLALARRAATETAIHRWDAEGALGRARALPPDLAADAIDEFLGVMAPVFFKYAEFGGTGQTIRLEATDRASAWQISVDADATVVQRSPEPTTADVTARGTASDLYLQLWGRGTVVPLELEGDADVFGRWRAAGAF